MYHSGESLFPAGHIFYIKAKSDTPDRQTLYVLRAPKRHRYQIPLVTLHRSTEFVTPCMQVQIEAVRPNNGRGLDMAFTRGRSFVVHGASKTPIVEKGDRVERLWGNRRFRFAGREFVWVTPEHPFDADTLYEVEKSWPKPGSKTGKREHKAVGRKLVWAEGKQSMKKIGLICMVGGLDQAFVEYILASQMAKMAVLHHGHG